MANWSIKLRRQIAEWAAQNGGESNPIAQVLLGFLNFLNVFFDGSEAPSEEADAIDGPTFGDETPAQERRRIGGLIVDNRAMPNWAEYQRRVREENGDRLPNVEHISPLTADGALTSDFGVDRGDHDHAGADIAAAHGTPVRATADGIVLFAGPKQGYGNCVIIGHADGTMTLYGHMQNGSIDHVRIGELVHQGERIGRQGNTGTSRGDPNLPANIRGSHVHYEQRGRDGRAHDPVINGVTVSPNVTPTVDSEIPAEIREMLHRSGVTIGDDGLYVAPRNVESQQLRQ